MKIWLKYLIGVALGVALSFAAPAQSPSVQAIIEFCASLALRIGRYMALPIAFTTCVAAVFLLRDSKHLFKTAVLTFAVIVASSLLLAVTGMISVLLVRLPRIPIAVEKVAQAPALNIRETVMNIFPYSPLETLLNGASLLPAFVFACLTGAACVAEKAKSKPVMTLIESLSDVFYACLSFIMDIMSIGMIAIACSWAINYFPVIQSGELTPLVIMFSVDFLIIACVIYPLLLFLLCCEKHPYKILYAALAPVIAAFFSGDTNYAFPFQIRHGMESLGIKRRVSGFVFPLFSAFARGGSAMVLTISFIVILRTYSPIGISVSDILWVTGVAFGLSFLLNAQSTGGAYTALAVLCAVYGSGFEAVYLLLKPAALIICAYAAAIDAVTAMFGSYLIASKLKMTEHHDLRHFL